MNVGYKQRLFLGLLLVVFVSAGMFFSVAFATNHDVADPPVVSPNDVFEKPKTGSFVVPEGDSKGTVIFDIITNAANWVFTILVIASVFVIFTAAFQFVTGGSDAAALTGARSKLIWAAVGIGLALLSRAIPTLIVNQLGGNGTQ